MKHAIMITAHNNIQILEKIISLYDDTNIDFFIHFDKKSGYINDDELQKKAHYSKIIFTNRIKVYWSEFSQIKTELILLKEATKGKYDYYHLISGVDMPLKSKTEFLRLFEINNGYEFIEFSPHEKFIEGNVPDRIKYYYFFLKNLRSNNVLLRKIQTFIRVQLLKLQKKMGINRIKKFEKEIRYGSNWFSITHEFAKFVIDKEKWVYQNFRYSSCADEIFIQTLFYNSDFYAKSYYDLPNRELLLGRYVDWDRGNPYTFRKQDFEILKNSSSFLFARKFDWNLDNNIVEDLYEYILMKNK